MFICRLKDPSGGGKNLKPDYIWFNGTASHYLVGDTFDPSKPLQLNELYGSYDDPDAKIYPVKIHRANQIYDARLQLSHPAENRFYQTGRRGVLEGI